MSGFIQITQLPIDYVKNKIDVSNGAIINKTDVDNLLQVLRNIEEQIYEKDKVKIMHELMKQWFTIGAIHSIQATEAMFTCLIGNARNGVWLEEAVKTYFGKELSKFVDIQTCLRKYNIHGDLIIPEQLKSKEAKMEKADTMIICGDPHFDKVRSNNNNYKLRPRRKVDYTLGKKRKLDTEKSKNKRVKMEI